MAYEVTATRKRPRDLDSLVGQEFVVATLRNSLKTGRVAHAYLFSGPRGVGKTSAARILAKALNCPDGPSPDPCDYPGAGEIERGSSLDVIEIDGASNTSVNDVRQIKDEVLFAPTSSRYKIYIIDEVHMLSNSAFNALLKTIEEPPPYIVFIFATTEVHKVPATIRSRCQQFTFRLIGIDAIRDLLRSACRDLGIQADDDALLWIAKEGSGSVRDAYTLFDQVAAFSGGHITMEQIKDKLGLVGLDRLNRLAELLLDGESAAAYELVDEVMASGVSVDKFVVDLADYYRTILLLREGVRRESLLGQPAESFSPRVVAAYSPNRIYHALDLLLELYRRIRYTVSERFELELAIGRLAALNAYVTGDEVVERVAELRRELLAGSASGGAPARDGEAAALAPPPAEHHELPAGVDVGNVETARIEGLIDAVARESHTASSVLAQAKAWSLNDGILQVRVDTAFAAQTLRTEKDAIRNAVLEVFGEEFSVRVLGPGADGSGEQLETGGAARPEADLVRKVFRGRILEEGSSDE